MRWTASVSTTAARWRARARPTNTCNSFLFRWGADRGRPPSTGSSSTDRAPDTIPVLPFSPSLILDGGPLGGHRARDLERLYRRACAAVGVLTKPNRTTSSDPPLDAGCSAIARTLARDFDQRAGFRRFAAGSKPDELDHSTRTGPLAVLKSVVGSAIEDPETERTSTSEIRMTTLARGGRPMTPPPPESPPTVGPADESSADAISSIPGGSCERHHDHLPRRHPGAPRQPRIRVSSQFADLISRCGRPATDTRIERQDDIFWQIMIVMSVLLVVAVLAQDRSTPTTRRAPSSPFANDSNE